MADVKLKTTTIEGKLVDIYVTDGGQFFGVAAGDDATHSNNQLAREWGIAKLTEELKKKLKQASARVAVPFAKLEKGVLRHGIARGIHATQDTILVTWSDGTKEALDRYERGILLVPSPEDEVTINQLAAVHEQKKGELAEAAAALDKALKPYELDHQWQIRDQKRRLTIREQVQAAIAKTVTP